MRIYAHRGASRYAPENTLAAFQKSVKFGADAIELDVRLSKDNVPVVIHDATINRTSNGKGFVHELTLKQLKTYDFGSSFSKTYAGEPIPTLEEVLHYIKDQPIDLNIELKNGPVIPEDLEYRVLKVVNHYKLENRTVFSSFDHKSLYRLSLLNKHLNIGLILHINLLNLFNYIDEIPFRLKSIHPNHFYVTEEMLQLAHERDLDVNVYTVNNKKLAKSYKELGIDGLITDDLLMFKK